MIMASAELKELVEVAKEAGLEVTELYNFLRDERTRQREQEKEEWNGRKISANGRKRNVNITENGKG